MCQIKHLTLVLITILISVGYIIKTIIIYQIKNDTKNPTDSYNKKFIVCCTPIEIFVLLTVIFKNKWKNIMTSFKKIDATTKQFYTFKRNVKN